MKRPKNLVPRQYNHERLPPEGLRAWYRGEWVTVRETKPEQGSMVDTMVVEDVRIGDYWIAARELWVDPASVTTPSAASS